MSLESNGFGKQNSPERVITIEDGPLFGNTLKDILRVRKITTQKLAGALNVSKKAVSCWLGGDNFPEADKIDAIARACDVSPKILMKAFEISKKARGLELAAKKNYTPPKRFEI
jgi:transcriptional regulator with XRE-family HTH domain